MKSKNCSTLFWYPKTQELERGTQGFLSLEAQPGEAFCRDLSLRYDSDCGICFPSHCSDSKVSDGSHFVLKWPRATCKSHLPHRCLQFAHRDPGVCENHFQTRLINTYNVLRLITERRKKGKYCKTKRSFEPWISFHRDKQWVAYLFSVRCHYKRRGKWGQVGEAREIWWHFGAVFYLIWHFWVFFLSANSRNITASLSVHTYLVLLSSVAAAIWFGSGAWRVEDALKSTSHCLKTPLSVYFICFPCFYLHSSFIIISAFSCWWKSWSPPPHPAVLAQYPWCMRAK